MTLWKYRAIPMNQQGAGASAAPEPVLGRLAGETAADVRAALRRAGLQPLDLKPLRPPLALSGTLGDAIASHLRTRRRSSRAEVFDALATMLLSGLPLLDALDALSRSQQNNKTRDLLLRLREALRGGKALSQSFGEERTWFDPVEIAMVRSGEHGGTLPDVLRTLSDRHERAGQFTHRLLGALAYPAIVTVLGLGVVLFLSTTTLPELVRILTDAGVETPALTARVLTVGNLIADSWLPIILISSIVIPGLLIGARRLSASSSQGPVARLWTSTIDRLRPGFVRRSKVGALATGLAELIRTGVPLTEALAVLAPTAGPRLGQTLTRARQKIEHGSPIALAFEDDAWFDAEFLRLLDLGHTTGELPSLLQRVGDRYRRSSERALDRFSALMEPAAILILAALVGTVALAAVLPLFRLQEVLR